MTGLGVSTEEDPFKHLCICSMPYLVEPFFVGTWITLYFGTSVVKSWDLGLALYYMSVCLVSGVLNHWSR